MLNKEFTIGLIRKIAIVSLVFFIAYFTTSFFEANLLPAVYHIFSMLLFAVFLSSVSLIPLSFFENKTMNYLGKISYGIYMFHCVVIQVVGFLYFKFLSERNLPETVTITWFIFMVVLLTIITAGLSYKYYESFFLKRKQFYR